MSLPFGILMALALAVHNIPEAAIQTSIVTKRGARLRDAAALAVVTNVNQVLLAVVSFSVLTAALAAFTLKGVTDGTVDLVAGLAAQTFTGTGVVLSFSKAIIRSNLNPPDGSVLPVLPRRRRPKREGGARKREGEARKREGGGPRRTKQRTAPSATSRIVEIAARLLEGQ